MASTRSSQQNGVRIDPTFLLRGIDVALILNNYIQGNYDNIKKPSTKLIGEVKNIKADQIVGKDDNSGIYEYVDRSGERRRIVTTNHRNYSIVQQQLKNRSYKVATNKYLVDGISHLPPTNFCMWCRRRTDSQFIPVGLPIKVEYNEKDNITIFHTVGNFCRFECCYSYLKSKNSSPFMFRHPRFIDSESLLLLLYHHTYPDKILRPAKDWELAEWNGGPLDEENYFNENHVYRDNLHIVYLPAKLEYVIENTISPLNNLISDNNNQNKPNIGGNNGQGYYTNRTQSGSTSSNPSIQIVD